MGWRYYCVTWNIASPLICSYLCSIPICDIDLFIIKFAKTCDNCLLTIELLSHLFSYPNNVVEVFDWVFTLCSVKWPSGRETIRSSQDSDIQFIPLFGGRDNWVINWWKVRQDLWFWKNLKVQLGRKIRQFPKAVDANQNWREAQINSI